MTRPCNILGELPPGQLRAFIADLPAKVNTESTDLDSTVLKCELIREHSGAHAHCVGALTDADGNVREIWATWGPEVDTKTVLWVTDLCANEWCIFFSGHAGACTPGHNATGNGA